MEVINPLNPPKNPLLIDLVLINLFEYCDFAELDKCRKVSRQWSKLAEKEWLKKNPIQDIFQTKKCNKNDDSDKRTGVRRENTINDADKWAASRYNKFRLWDYAFGSKLHEQFINVWETRGHLITFLELAHCNIISANAFRGLIFCKATTCLQTLKFTHVRFSFLRKNKNNTKTLSDKALKDPPVCTMRHFEIEYDADFRNLAIGWNLVLQCYPYLESLVLRKYATSIDRVDCEIERVFDGLKSFHQENGRTHQLENLNVTDSSNYSDWKTFPDGVFNHIREEIKTNQAYNVLQRPEVLFIAEYPDEKTTNNNNNNNNNNSDDDDDEQLELKRLKLQGILLDHWIGPTTNLQLPEILKLTRLDLINYNIVSFNFLLNCTNLKHCNIILRVGNNRNDTIPIISNKHNAIRDNMIGWGLEEKRSLLLPSLLSFHCNMLMDWNCSDMLQLSQWAPNLTSLLIFATNSTFRGICQGFSKLEKLFLYSSMVTDASFTGLRQVFLNGGRIEEALLERRPNITNLKNLHVLGVRPSRHDYLSRRPLLSEVSVIHGLLQLSSLKQIYIPKTGISAAGFEILKQNLKANVIKRTHTFPFGFVSLAMFQSQFHHD